MHGVRRGCEDSAGRPTVGLSEADDESGEEDALDEIVDTGSGLAGLMCDRVRP